MGTVSTASVSVALSADGLSVDATYSWTIDAPGAMTILVTPITPGANPGRGSLNSAPVAGSLTVHGLTPGADYTSTIAFVDDFGAPYAYGPMAPADGVLTFTAPAMTGPADQMTVRASSTNTTLSAPVTLFVSASSSGSSVGGREIDFNIHNGDDRGSFNPNPAQTISGSEAAIVFTPAKKGKAQIQILVDKVSKNVDVMVN
jgi:hypothetical protein